MKPTHPPLTPDQLGGLAKLVGLTHDHEFDCAECLQHVGEFAEHQLAGRSNDETLAKVEQHLALCPECKEEWLALKKILEAGH